ncbi:MAG TPA: alpha/beta fold hydrolase [Candidatus Binataceae bacterium]|jgi:pimeloyl-ACP methyl ester carboxylesterase|nr:alpha/beta fold hydrolase [Candidatus Binataceae bacterium]
MHELKTLNLRRGLFEVKYYQHGKGTPLVYLHGAGGLPGFTPDLELLSSHFTVTAPLHPGFGSSGIDELHEDVLKFTLYTWDVLDALGIERPILVGHSLGGMLAAEMAALEPTRVRKLVLVAPAGLWLDECPTLDFFAMKPEELIAAAFYDPDSAAARAFATLPTDPSAAAEVMVQRMRGLAAAARFLWPLGDRGLGERLYRVKAPTLLLWGEADKLIPPRYAEAFKRLLEGSPEVKIEKIARAGHVVLAEQTQAAVDAIVSFTRA